MSKMTHAGNSERTAVTIHKKFKSPSEGPRTSGHLPVSRRAGPLGAVSLVMFWLNTNPTLHRPHPWPVPLATRRAGFSRSSTRPLFMYVFSSIRPLSLNTEIFSSMSPIMQYNSKDHGLSKNANLSSIPGWRFISSRSHSTQTTTVY